MKSKSVIGVCVGLGFITIALIGWQFNEKSQYDEIFTKPGGLPFKAYQMGDKEQAFVNKAKATWSRDGELDPSVYLQETIKKLGFGRGVKGLAHLYTFKLPQYSIFDKERNLRSQAIGIHRREDAMLALHLTPFVRPTNS